jgi:hypothetical protein
MAWADRSLSFQHAIRGMRQLPQAGASTLERAAGCSDLAWPVRLAVALITPLRLRVRRWTTPRNASDLLGDGPCLDRKVIAMEPTLAI